MANFGFVFPWQRNALMGHVLGGRPLIPGPADRLTKEYGPPPPVSKAVAAPRKCPPLTLTPKAPPMKRFKVTKAQDESVRRDKLLEQWAKILGLRQEASNVGKLMKESEGEGEAKDTLRYSLIDKSTSTLASRLASVTGYLSWMEGRDLWPPDEAAAFRYLRDCAGAKEPASRAS
eukprot:2633613-Karenia_brevis.AAC.1